MRLTIATKFSLFSAAFIALTAASIITTFYFGGTRSLLTNSLKQYSTLAQQEGQRLNSLLTDSANDILFVAQSQPLSAYAEQLSSGTTGETTTLEALGSVVQQEFRNRLEHGGDYRQLRFIDTAGRERVRVDRQNHRLITVEGAALQDKSANSYVTETLALPRGKIYFSDITLNREYGKVVEPHTPTLRIATPVTGSNGQQVIGMLILNVDIGRHLRHVRSALGDVSEYAYITNTEGSYLSHHDSRMTFGFDSSYDHRVQELLPELDAFYRQPLQQHIVLLPSQNKASLAVAFRKIRYDRSHPDRFIAVGIASPRELILSDELSLIRRNVFWAILLTIAGIFTALIFSLRITRPLSVISTAVQNFSHERAPFDQPPSGGDEIAQLGYSIKYLTDEVLDNEHRLNALNTTLEQRVAERSRELRSSQKILETILNALPNRIFWKDTKGKYLGCNQNFVKDAGLGAPWEIIGKTDHDMPWAEHAADYQQDDRSVIETAQPKLNIIKPITLADGTTQWLETNKLPLYGAEAQLIGLLGSYQDITERRNAEFRLSNSEKRLRNSQRIAHVGTWDWDIANNTLHWSDEIYAIFGLQRQQFPATYDGFLEYIHPGDVEVVVSAVERSINNVDFPYYVTHRVVRPDGEIRYVEEQGEVYRDAKGLPVRMLGVVHDITENTLIQLELHREKERTERYLQVSEALIVALDTEGHITRINQRGCTLLGYRMDKLRGRNWFDTVIPPDIRDEVKTLFATLMSQPQPADEKNHSSYYENELLNRNGERITIAWHNTIDYDEKGIATGTLSSGQDITQRKRIEKFKDEFLSTVSHELRTPLTSIRGSLRLILGQVVGEVPHRVLKLLQVADNNSERLLLLINDLLDLQKMRAGMMSFHFEPLSPLALLQEAVENNTPYASQHGIELTLHHAQYTGHDQFCGDHDRLIQVMNNLISNAIKFSPHGARVELILTGDEQQLLIQVNDKGPGIPPQFHTQLFEKFTQVDSSDTRQLGGTGLGLNIARLIVERHHGTIDYHDNPGGGSSFRITLPSVDADCQRRLG